MIVFLEIKMYCTFHVVCSLHMWKSDAMIDVTK